MNWRDWCKSRSLPPAGDEKLIQYNGIVLAAFRCVYRNGQRHLINHGGAFSRGVFSPTGSFFRFCCVCIHIMWFSKSDAVLVGGIVPVRKHRKWVCCACMFGTVRVINVRSTRALSLSWFMNRESCSSCLPSAKECPKQYTHSPLEITKKRSRDVIFQLSYYFDSCRHH